MLRDLLLDEDVKRVSSCELEVDIVAADILNRLQVDGLYNRSVQKYSRVMTGQSHDSSRQYGQTDIHLFNSVFSKTTRVRSHLKGKTILDFNEARDDGVAVASAANRLHLADR